MAQRKTKKASLPRLWSPTEAGSTIEGEYLGKLTKVGPIGSFSAIAVLTADGPLYFGGTAANELITVNKVGVGDWVRFTFLGREEFGEAFKRHFDLEIEDK